MEGGGVEEAGLPGADSGTWKGSDGKLVFFPAPYEVCSDSAAQVPKRNPPVSASDQHTPKISRLPSLNSHPVPPSPKPRRPLGKNLHSRPDLWVIRKSKTNSPHQENAGHLPALGNLYANSGSSAGFGASRLVSSQVPSSVRLSWQQTAVQSRELSGRGVSVWVGRGGREGGQGFFPKPCQMVSALSWRAPTYSSILPFFYWWSELHNCKKITSSFLNCVKSMHAESGGCLCDLILECCDQPCQACLLSCLLERVSTGPSGSLRFRAPAFSPFELHWLSTRGPSQGQESSKAIRGGTY